MTHSCRLLCLSFYSAAAILIVSTLTPLQPRRMLKKHALRTAKTRFINPSISIWASSTAKSAKLRLTLTKQHTLRWRRSIRMIHQAKSGKRTTKQSMWPKSEVSRKIRQDSSKKSVKLRIKNSELSTHTLLAHG